MHPHAPLTHHMKFADLFCGLGAFHTAFKDELHCVFACDIDKQN